MFGVHYSEFWGKISAMLVYIGFNLTFFPQFILGYVGMPRRYHAYPPEFQVLNIFSTAGATVLGVGMVLPVIYLTLSLYNGRKCGANPWLLPGLEWRTSSPPPTENFVVTPVVTWEAYEFGEESGLDAEEALEIERETATV
jgi:cytochrome c oxidase subunit 1